MTNRIQGLSYGMKGKRVEQLQAALRQQGFEITDRQGYFGVPTRQALKAFQRQHNLEPTGVVDADTAALLEQAVAETPSEQLSDQRDNSFLIHGQVTKTDNTPLCNVAVKAYRKALRQECLVGENTTDEKGLYSISYQPEKGNFPPDKPVNLLLRVYQQEEEIATSPVLFNAQPEEEYDLMVVSDKVKLASEFEKVAAKLQMHAQDLPPAEWTAEEITFIAAETGLDSQRTRDFALSYRLQAKTNLPTEILYGLLRQEKPANLTDLLTRDAASWRRSLTMAAKANIINPPDEEAVESLVTVLQDYSVKRVMEVVESPERPMLKATLGTVLSEDQIKTVLKVHQQSGSPQVFWERLKQEPEFTQDGTIEKLQFTLQAGTLTGGHPPLIKQLQAMKQEQKFATLYELAHRLPTRNEWQELLHQHDDDDTPVGAPAWVPGEDDADRVSNYSTLLARSLEVALPTAVMAGQLFHDPSAPADVGAFFEENPSFEFRQMPVKRFLRRHPEALDYADSREEVAETLVQMQRRFHLSPRFEKYPAMAALREAGIHSAVQVSHYGRRAFADSFSGPLGGLERTEEVYNSALKRLNTSLTLYMNFSSDINSANTNVIPAPADWPTLIGENGEFTPEDIEDIQADWRTMFGSLDFCDCEECRSVYSPAAYLADILFFLKRISALEELLKRRPDIARIKLNCHNTNTPVPYIDLVNEALENLVAPLEDVPTDDVRSQTTWSAEELAANPEHHHQSAYEQLKNAIFPWHLPFDLNTAEARIYLEHLGIKRHELMQTMEWPPAPVYKRITMERLGLNETLWSILTGSNGVAPCWGMTRISSLYDLAKDIPQLLKRSDLSFKELLSLLEAEFVNPHYRLLIKFTDETGDGGPSPDDLCKLERACFTRRDGGGLSRSEFERFLGRLHRFVRLQRTLGWSLLELDEAISVLGDGRLNGSCLGRIGRLLQLQEQVRLPLLELLSWYGNISIKAREGEPSFYHELFLNKSVVNPVNALFELGGDSLVGPGDHHILDPDYNHLDTIQAALGSSHEDLTLLITHYADVDTDGDEIEDDMALSLENLTLLYRHVSLANALQLSIRELLSMLALTELNPFNKRNMANTLAFIDKVIIVESSEFEPDELVKLLMPPSPDDEIVEETLTILSEMRTRLLEIDNTFQIPDDLSESGDDALTQLARSWLSQVMDASLVERAITIIEPYTELTVEEDDARRKFISDHFSIFKENIRDLQVELVGEPPLSDRFSRFRCVLVPLSAYLQKTYNTAFVKEKLTGYLNIPQPDAEICLNHVLAVGSTTQPAYASFLTEAFLSDESEMTPDDFSDQRLTLRRLRRVARLVEGLNLNGDNLAFVFRHSQAGKWLDLSTLPTHKIFDRWHRLVDLLELQIDFAAEDTSLFTVIEPVLLFDAVSDDLEITKEQVIQALSQLTGWPESDLHTLMEKFRTYPDNLNSLIDPQFLRRLEQCFEFLRLTGVSAEMLWSWQANAAVTLDTATAIKQTAKAKYTNEAWLKVARPLRNVLREQQRQALVAYLVANPNGRNWQNANDLYAHLLLDVEMSACMMTSRIKQAISSVQLYMQRCLMNLEDNVSIGVTDARQWKTWRKSYRLWAANRKVFLYPENWIEPELRNVKSPFFEELESELMQNDVTTDVVEAAFLRYLDKLKEVAHLEICGLYHEQDDTADVDIVHVFGRTGGDPPIYYYRQYVDDHYWMAWERVDLDIQGDHLIPLVANRRLCLFWPIFTEKPDESQDEQESTRPRRYWEIKMAWSEYKDGHWSAKKVSKDALYDKFDFAGHHPAKEYSEYRFMQPKITQQGNSIDWTKEHFFFLTDDNGQIFCWHHKHFANIVHNEPPIYFSSGGFSFNICTGEIHPFFRKQCLRIKDRKPVESVKKFMSYQQFSSEKRFELPIHDSSTEKVEITPVLDSGNGYTLLVASDYVLNADLFPWERPFFYRDSHSTFFVSPHDRKIGESGPDVTKPDLLNLEHISRVMEHEKIVLLASEIPPEPPSAVEELPIPAPHTSMIATTATGIAIAERAGGIGNLSYPTVGDYAPRRVHINGNILDDLVLFDAELGTYPDFYTPIRDMASWMGTDPAILMRYETVKKFRFDTFYHPHVCAFIEPLRQYSIAGLLDPNPEIDTNGLRRQQIEGSLDFKDSYAPTSCVLNKDNYPKEDIDFEGAYAIYNWELFFHIPFLIANRLSTNQRFEEAQAWFHYIFDPTTSPEPDVEGRKRFWKTRPFYEVEPRRLRELLLLIFHEDADMRAILEKQLEQWAKYPFQPHRIATIRHAAYMKAVVMKYLDNLIGWGDQLFRQDSIESINEATQLYILAAEILGAPPQSIPTRDVQALSFNELSLCIEERPSDTNEFPNALVPIESYLPPLPSDLRTPLEELPIPGETFYFCIPNNTHLLEYWHIISDRLFKIRHCMNIEGIVRQLPLFEPPIDPGMIVKAAAAGVDIGAVLSDLNAPLPNYRFEVMVRRAIEICNDVKLFGGMLLQVIEKRDVESLSLIRSGHEIQLLENLKFIREQQIEEATQTRDSLIKAIEIAQQKKDFYESREFMSELEVGHLAFISASGILRGLAQLLMIGSSSSRLIPEVEVGISGVAGSPVSTVRFGGANVSDSMSGFSTALSGIATWLETFGQSIGIVGGYERRAQDWAFQAEQAIKEMEQLALQQAAAEVRIAIAEAEQTNLDRQIENAEEIESYMREKFNNKELYSWMVSEIAKLYFQSYQIAYDIAKKAEKAYAFELGRFDDTFIQFGYWDSLKAGLLAADKLHYDLRRMETVYLEHNKREFELTKHISLAVLNPIELIRLKETGQCNFSIPEILFDMDFPGHYMRRIKSIGITIPCVTGPYTSINAILTLLNSQVRIKTQPSNGVDYYQDTSDTFHETMGAFHSIATSSGQNDRGLFELNFQDSRYLPFEGAGAISSWRLDLPRDCNQFDFDTISDVILHLNYTSRDGGPTLKQAAEITRNNILSGETSELWHCFSARHEFAPEWHRFINSTNGYILNLDLTSHFPLRFQDSVVEINNAYLFVKLHEKTDAPDSLFTLKNPENEVFPLKQCADIVFDNILCYVGNATGNSGCWSLESDSLESSDLTKVDDIIFLFQYKMQYGVW